MSGHSRQKNHSATTAHHNSVSGVIRTPMLFLAIVYPQEKDALTHNP